LQIISWKECSLKILAEAFPRYILN